MLIDFKKATFEKNRLIIHENVTPEEWNNLGKNLGEAKESVQFWIGDWARFGDKMGFTGKYTDPKVYDHLEKITGLERDTIRKYKSVAERTSGIRIPDLEYSHHREVAHLPEEKQREFLTKASEEHLSVRSLREAIKEDASIVEVEAEEIQEEKPTQIQPSTEKEIFFKRSNEIIAEINKMPVIYRVKIKQSIKS